MNMPPYEIPEGYKAWIPTSATCVMRATKKGIQREEQAAYLSQLEYEIDMILKMGSRSILLLWDFLRWAREQGL